MDTLRPCNLPEWQQTPPGAQTVFPSRPGVFPPASFFCSDDAWNYVWELQAGELLPCGIHVRPAYSYRLQLEGKA